MPLEIHTIETPDNAAPTNTDKLVVGLRLGLTNAAGGGAGQAVTVTVNSMQLPASYVVLVDPHQDATWFTSAHTNVGFNVTLAPRLAANTIAAGTIDLAIFA